MSISFMALAWKADIPSGRKLVLVALCDHANGQGECYPSVEAIARKCSMGQRTVQQHIGELESVGILMRRFRKGRSTLYRLEPHNFCSRAGAAAPQDSAVQCAAPGTSPPQNSHVTPAAPAPISISEASMKSSCTRQVVRGTPLPPTWTLPESWADWAIQLQPTWTAAHMRFVAEKFRDHWTAMPGGRGIKADWLATWRNWCRNEEPPAQNKNTGDGCRPTASATHGKTAIAKLAPLPGESVAAFDARVMRQRENAGTQLRPHALVTPHENSPATHPASSANRAAALSAARALKSRLQKPA